MRAASKFQRNTLKTDDINARNLQNIYIYKWKVLSKMFTVK